MSADKRRFAMPYAARDQLFDVMSYIIKLSIFYGVMFVGFMYMKGYPGSLVFSIGLVSSMYVIYEWLLLNFTEKHKYGEISKLGKTFLVRNRQGYIYFKKNDIIAATVKAIGDANYLLELKLKQCFFYRGGLFNCGYIVLDSNKTNASECDPLKYLDVLNSLPLDRYELRYETEHVEDEDRDLRIAIFSTNELSAEIKFADEKDCENICAYTLELAPDQVAAEAQNTEMQK